MHADWTTVANGVPVNLLLCSQSFVKFWKALQAAGSLPAQATKHQALSIKATENRFSAILNLSYFQGCERTGQKISVQVQLTQMRHLGVGWW